MHVYAQTQQGNQVGASCLYEAPGEDWVQRRGRQRVYVLAQNAASVAWGAYKEAKDQDREWEYCQAL